MICGEEAGKSKTNWIGCFDEDCNIASVVLGKLGWLRRTDMPGIMTNELTKSKIK